ncbi:MAG TPA: hypothetical protein VN457_06490, partial [Chlamydiales bacterium]|nr:hypothetical protein [Chlamydiales bacterium]
MGRGKDAFEASPPTSRATTAQIPQQLLTSLTLFHSQVMDSEEISAEGMKEWFTAIKSQLQNDPEIAGKLQELESDKALIDTWENNPAADWKKPIQASDGNAITEATKNKSPEIDSQRRHVVKVVGEIAEIIARRAGFTASTAIDFGSLSKDSDIDVTIMTKSKQYKDHAQTGQKAAFASIVWQALFGGSSLKQADTEFYPTHIAQYLDQEIRGSQAENIYAQANFCALFLQIFTQMEDHSLEAFEKGLESQMKKRGLGELQPQMREMIRDVKNLLQQMNRAKEQMPEGYKDMANTIFANKFSAELAVLGQKIDRLEKSDPRRSELVAKFAFLANIRAAFLPEGYITKGAFDTVCKDAGGQLHSVHDKKFEEALIHATDLAKAKGQTVNREALVKQLRLQFNAEFATSSPLSLMTSVGENGA